MYKLVLEDLAVIEMQEAFEWYESQEAGLGFDLIEKAEACFQVLQLRHIIITIYPTKKEEYILKNILTK
jgi:hypothetical protein